MRHCKVVLVGDHGAGKIRFAFAWEGCLYFDYMPSVFDNTSRIFRVGEEEVEVQMWDTTGEEEYKKLRPLAYPQSDIILLVFRYDHVETLENLLRIWGPEVREHCPTAPRILVGLWGGKGPVDRNDFRMCMHLPEYWPPPFPEEMIQEVMEGVGAVGYVQCTPFPDEVAIAFDRILEIWMEHVKEAEARKEAELRKQKKRKWWQIKKKGGK